MAALVLPRRRVIVPTRPSVRELLGRIWAAMHGSGSGGSAPPEADREAIDLRDLITEHSDAVFRVALSVVRNRDLAEDVAQDAMVKAWLAIDSYRGDAPLKHWLLRITRNTAISALRRQREEARDPMTMPERETTMTVSKAVEERLSMTAFEDALSNVDELSRSIVVLREVEGMSYEAIADIVGVSLPTVKTRLMRARRILASALEEWAP